MQPRRTQYNSARARGESVSQPTRSIGHRGPNGSIFSNHSIFEMIEFAARKAPTEKFNGQEPARWFIYKRLVEDEANASGCLSEIVPNPTTNYVMRSNGSRVRNNYPSEMVSSASVVDVRDCNAVTL
jgi:hypothetical protein